MKKHRERRIQILHRIQVCLLAFMLFGILSSAGHPLMGAIFSAMTIVVGFGLVRLPYGILGEAAIVPPLTKEHLDQIKEASREAMLTEFGGLVEGKAAIKSLTDIMKQITEKKTVEEVLAMKPEIEGFKNEIMTIKAALEKAKGGSGDKKGRLHSIENSFMKGLKNFHKSGQLQSLKKNSNHSGLAVWTSKKRVMDNGALVDNPMSDTTSVVPIGTGIPTIITQFEPGLTRVTRRKPFIAMLVDLAQTLDRYVSWMEQTNIDTGIAFTVLEGGSNAANYGSFRWTQNSTECQEIVALSKMTLVLLDDLQNAQQEVQTEIVELLGLKLDAQIFSGNGNAPNLKGITSYAQGFVNTGLSVQAPNNYDAIIAAILQIKVNGIRSGIAGGGEIINIFQPTDICLNPVDYTQMILTKDTLNRYIREFYPNLQGDTLLADCKITENIGVAQGFVLVMDASKSHARIRLDASLTLGYVNTDFADGLVTIKGTLRAAHYIKGVETNAFVYDSFVNIKAAIQAI